MTQPALPAARRAEPWPGPAGRRSRSATSSSRSTSRGPRCCSSSRTPAMALSIAGHGYVMETGKLVLDKPAAVLRRGRGRARVLPRPARRRPGPLVPRRQALPAAQAVGCRDARRGPCAAGRRPVLDVRGRPPSLRRRPGAARRLVRGRRERAVRDHRPQRRRQDLAVQLPLGPLPARSRGRSASSAATWSESAPDRDRRAPASPGPSRTSSCSRTSPCSTTCCSGRHLHVRYGVARGPASGWAGPSARRSVTARVVEEIVEFLEIERYRKQPGRRSCPTASRSGSSSAGRWPWSRSCCSSTSPSPA